MTEHPPRVCRQARTAGVTRGGASPARPAVPLLDGVRRVAAAATVG